MTDQPDPEAIYEAVRGFTSAGVPGYSPERPFVAHQGWQALGDHPAVIAQWANGLFRLAPQDAIRRQLLAVVRSRQEVVTGSVPPETPAAPPRAPGRPAWTRERFWERYRAAEEKAGPHATDQQLAEQFGYDDARQLRRLANTFGRPAE